MLRFWRNAGRQFRDSEDATPLPRGGVKPLLIDAIGQMNSGFGYLGYRNGTYIFERTKEHRQRTLYEAIRIPFSLAEGIFDPSIASCFNPISRFESNYRTDDVNPHVSLMGLAKGNVLRYEDAYYRHDGSAQGVQAAINEIVRDLSRYGLPWFDRRSARLPEDEVVNTGLDFLEQLHVDPGVLERELQACLKEVKFVAYRIKHPVYEDLKQRLLAVRRQNAERRQRNGITALAFLELYASSDSSSPA